ncbi:hypothetical protein, partial [Shewanella sp. NIFS-20-20]|uniref:hypothetical protein n=1 Tax=Shewanella sp. NIFS-20-20 TaxID=2853806 RepID=UPI001C46CF70
VLGKGKKAHDRVSAKESIRSQRHQIEKLCPFDWLKFVRDLTLRWRLIVTNAGIVGSSKPQRALVPSSYSFFIIAGV